MKTVADTAGSGRLMGGTGILVFNTTVGRLLHKGKGGNPMGRWSYVHLKQCETMSCTYLRSQRIDGGVPLTKVTGETVHI
jgi:hypothetical protein